MSVWTFLFGSYDRWFAFLCVDLNTVCSWHSCWLLCFSFEADDVWLLWKSATVWKDFNIKERRGRETMQMRCSRTSVRMESLSWNSFISEQWTIGNNKNGRFLEHLPFRSAKYSARTLYNAKPWAEGNIYETISPLPLMYIYLRPFINLFSV